MPDFHVQTISGTRCHSLDDVHFKIKTAVDAGAGALLMVSGDGGSSNGGGGSIGGVWVMGNSNGSKVRGSKRAAGAGAAGGGFYLDSLGLLREAVWMREAEPPLTLVPPFSLILSCSTKAAVAPTLNK